MIHKWQYIDTPKLCIVASLESTQTILVVTMMTTTYKTQYTTHIMMTKHVPTHMVPCMLAKPSLNDAHLLLKLVRELKTSGHLDDAISAKKEARLIPFIQLIVGN